MGKGISRGRGGAAGGHWGYVLSETYGTQTNDVSSYR